MKTLVWLVLGGLICMSSCVGCTQAGLHASVKMPSAATCWLSDYYRALKSKDMPKVEDLSCTIPNGQAEGMGAEGAEFMHASRKQLMGQLMEHIQQMCGDFKDYSVDSCAVDHISDSSQFGQFLGSGTVINIVCDSSYSKKNVKENFVLFEGDQDHELSLQTHVIQ